MAVIAACSSASSVVASSSKGFLPNLNAVVSGVLTASATVAASSRQVATVTTSKTIAPAFGGPTRPVEVSSRGFFALAWAVVPVPLTLAATVAGSSRQVATATSSKAVVPAPPISASVATSTLGFIALPWNVVGVPQTPLSRMTAAAISYKFRADLPALMRPVGRYGNSNSWIPAKRVPPAMYADLEIPALELTATASVGAAAALEIPAPVLTAAATTAVIEAPITMNAALLLDAPTLAAYGAAQGALEIPALELEFEAHRDTATVALTIAAPALTAYAGTGGRMTIPAPTATATGTNAVMATAVLEIEAPELTATGLTGDVSQVALTIPAPTLTAYTAARSESEIPAPTLTATGTLTSGSTATLTIPAPGLVATGQTYTRATVTLTLPSPVLHAGTGNYANLTLPAPTMSATVRLVSTAGETTYAVNLNTGAVTQLLLGGFDKLVTAHGYLYGLKNGALTRLEGDTDPGAVAIPMTVRFAPQDFGTRQVKRVSDVYLSVRESDGLTLDLIQDETTAWTYQTATDTAPAYGTHKLKTGKGIRFHTVGLVIKNRNGGKLDLGGLELNLSELARKPR